MIHTVLFILIFKSFTGVQHNEPTAKVTENPFELLSCDKIWDKAPHNAFTDIIRFKGRWFLIFREAGGHVSYDGTFRILTLNNGGNWESASQIALEKVDLRDAKYSVSPGRQLMITGGGRSGTSFQSYTWFSDDGIHWSRPFEIGDTNFWLWRTTWHHKNAYNFGYSSNRNDTLKLYSSRDGKTFKLILNETGVKSYPNETSIVFKKDTAFCLLRRDGTINSGLVGVALPPYNSWSWKDLGIKIGGPYMMVLPNGKLLAAVRLYGNDKGLQTRTSLCLVDPPSGKLTEVLSLPSGGDTSYAGMVLFKNVLWISYYSSHEGKTSIYLAKVKIAA